MCVGISSVLPRDPWGSNPGCQVYLYLLDHFAHLEHEIFLLPPLLCWNHCVLMVADGGCYLYPSKASWSETEFRPQALTSWPRPSAALCGQRPAYCHVTAFPSPPPPHPQPVLSPRAQLSHRGPAQPFAPSPLPATVFPSPSPFRSPPVPWLG